MIGGGGGRCSWCKHDVYVANLKCLEKIESGGKHKDIIVPPEVRMKSRVCLPNYSPVHFALSSSANI